MGFLPISLSFLFEAVIASVVFVLYHLLICNLGSVICNYSYTTVSENSFIYCSTITGSNLVCSPSFSICLIFSSL